MNNSILKNKIKGVWFLGTIEKNRNNNLGDLLGYLLPNKLFPNNKIFNKKLINKDNALVCVGSVINGNSRNTIYLGTGTVFNNVSVNDSCTILCTRGPLTSKAIKSNPPWITDTGILISIAYPRPIKLYKYDIVVILHKVDENFLNLLKSNNIPVRTNWGKNIEDLINFICSGRIVISSSLHGQVISHSYGIPSIAVNCNNKVIGGEFKFKDYYASLNNGSTKNFIYPMCKNINDFKNASKYVWVTNKNTISQKQNELIKLFNKII